VQRVERARLAEGVVAAEQQLAFALSAAPRFSSSSW